MKRTTLNTTVLSFERSSELIAENQKVGKNDSVLGEITFFPCGGFITKVVCDDKEILDVLRLRFRQPQPVRMDWGRERKADFRVRQSEVIDADDATRHLLRLIRVRTLTVLEPRRLQPQAYGRFNETGLLPLLLVAAPAILSIEQSRS